MPRCAGYQLSAKFLHECVVPETIPPTKRTRVVRGIGIAALRSRNDLQILDEGFVCHVGFSIEGQPYVVHAVRAHGDALYFMAPRKPHVAQRERRNFRLHHRDTHGPASFLARSVFNHSMNYRSVVHSAGPPSSMLRKKSSKRCIPSPRKFSPPLEDSRQPNEKELKATSILRLPLRSFRKDFASDLRRRCSGLSIAIWAGVIPLQLTPGAPIATEVRSSDSDFPPMRRTTGGEHE